MKTETLALTRAHHPFSPSTLQYREACPYYDPAGGDNEKARLGTRQHNAVEATDDDHQLSDQQAMVVADCLAYFENLKRKYPGCTVIAEEYLPIDDYRGFYQDWKGGKHEQQATTAGYLDRALISADRKKAEICDWKFGEWSVEDAEHNVQGFCYLLGLVKRIPTLEEVTVHFVMPYRDEVTFATFFRGQFLALHQRIRAIVFRAAQAREVRDFSQAIPSSACLFCGNAGRCDALSAMALKIGNKFSPLEVPENITPSLLQDPKMAGAGLQVAGVISTWAKAFRAEKTAQALESGLIPEGYQLVGSSDRVIVNPQKLREVCQQFGLTDEEIASACSYHITPIDTLIRAKSPRGSKDATAEALSEALITAGAVERTPEVACLRAKKK